MAGRWLKILFQPKVVISVALAGSLLAFAVSLGDLPKALEKISELSVPAVSKAFGWTAAYLIIKLLELNFLLKRSGIYPNRRQLGLAYAIGEMTVPIPAGVYIQNYVLEKVQGAAFVQSSASTSVMLLLEVYLILGTLSFLRIPGWEWVRFVSIFVLVSGTGLAVISEKSRRIRDPIARWMKRTAFGRGLVEMLTEMREMVKPRILIPAVLLSAIYLGAMIRAFLDVSHSVGAPNLSYEQALKIYFFSLGIVFILAGTTQLGIMETAGLGAASAIGYSYTQGLAMMLGFRIVWLGSIYIIAGTFVLIFRKQFRSLPADGGDKSTD